MACLQQPLKTNLEQIDALVLGSAAVGTFSLLINLECLGTAYSLTHLRQGRTGIEEHSCFSLCLSVSPPTQGTCRPLDTYIYPLPVSTRTHHSCSLEGDVP